VMQGGGGQEVKRARYVGGGLLIKLRGLGMMSTVKMRCRGLDERWVWEFRWWERWVLVIW